MQQIGWFDATLKRAADYLCQSGSCFVSSRTRIMKCACFHREFVASAHLKLRPCVAGTANMFREHSMTHIRHSKTGHLNQLHPLAPRASIRSSVVPRLMLLPGRGSTHSISIHGNAVPMLQSREGNRSTHTWHLPEIRGNECQAGDYDDKQSNSSKRFVMADECGTVWALTAQTHQVRMS